MISLNQVSFSYSEKEEESIIRQVTLSINKGEFIAIVGPNGSGKSTLAKLMNGLLIPTKGVVHIDDLQTSNNEDLWKIRQKVGMVFQNPENQIVATTVLDDVAFGLENVGCPPSEMMDRIKDALMKVNMWTHQEAEPHHLSGGQKQRVAIAGILAIKPEIIVFDESTSMLDPEGRSQVLEIMQELHKEGLTILTITHDMEEAMHASRVIIVKEGSILRDESPTLLFENIALLEENDLEVPFAIEVRETLKQHGVDIPSTIQKKEELVQYLWTL